jgi:hypothetical protein
MKTATSKPSAEEMKKIWKETLSEKSGIPTDGSPYIARSKNLGKMVSFNILAFIMALMGFGTLLTIIGPIIFWSLAYACLWCAKKSPSLNCSSCDWYLDSEDLKECPHCSVKFWKQR